MKKNILYIILATLTGLLSNSCTKDFENINVDPSIVSDVDVRYLFTSSCEKLQTVRSGEWTWEDLEQFLRVSQLLTAQAYELQGSVNTRYNYYYTYILPNLFEMRRLIDNKTDKDKFQKIYATTFIIQVYQGLRVTDVNGSVPYTEANQGRDFAKYDPVYDNQKTLYDTWLGELNNSIQVLGSSLADQVSFGNNDVFYKGDWTKWIKLANSLKLRIAARYQNPDETKAAQIFNEVMTDATGPFSSLDDQMTYNNPNYMPFTSTGYMIDYRSVRYAIETVVDYMKSTGDPRLGIYYSQNDLVGSYKDTLTKYGKTLPSWCDLNDPLIKYQGGPADFQSNPEKSTYFSNQFDAGGANRWWLISTINRTFFAPQIGNGSGKFVDVMVSYAEVCLHIAEFIEKGYGSGFGTAKEWYDKGVLASAITMNNIASVANSTTVSDISALVATYLTNPKVALDGTDNLEKIYIQELLNFYRQGNEAFTLVRRTGYPKFGSTLLAREPVPETLYRRFWLLDPGEVNRANYNAAMSEQGFTPNDQSMSALSTQRIWFDINSPEYGEGN
jgi:hypothetical protein